MKLRRASAADQPAVVAVQRRAYARNRVLLGVEPMPLLADYDVVFRDMEVWVSERQGQLEGVLIVEPRVDDLLIWSIAVDPTSQTRGLGSTLLAEAEGRACELGRRTVRLYTGTALVHLVAWYKRHGFTVEQIEELHDRSVTHMLKITA